MMHGMSGCEPWPRMQEYLRATELAKYTVNAECTIREAEAKGAAQKAVVRADAEAKAEAKKLLTAADAEAQAEAQRVLADADNYTKQQVRLLACLCPAADRRRPGAKNEPAAPFCLHEHSLLVSAALSACMSALY
jgi:regulator of protease activity HflC (stomatin/prohibitin superfamily)